MPFSACSTTDESAGRCAGISVGMPIPRLTYCPSESSAAARAAISSWLQPVLTAVSLISVAFRSRSRGGLLDLLAGGLLRRQLDDPVHEDTRHVYVVGVDLDRKSTRLNSSH